MVNSGPAQPQESPDQGPADTTERISLLISDPLPPEALTANVEGRKITKPDNGFGKLWRKQYWIRLEGSNITPVEVIDVWKQRYTEFWPKGSHLYQPSGGLRKGDKAAADLALIGGTRIGTGIVVIDERDTSFTFATLQGHMLCGTIDFSARDDNGVTVAEVETVMRAGDPLYEIGMPLGGHRHENSHWKASLVALAKYFGVEGTPEMSMECIDKRRKWQNAVNIRHNAFLRTSALVAVKTFRQLASRLRSRGGSA